MVDSLKGVRMNDLKVSNIEIMPMRNPKNGLVGFCSFVLNDSIYIGYVGIYTCRKNNLGFRLVYPTKKTKNGDNFPCVYPINRETGDTIERVVISRYRDIIEDALINE